MFSLERLFLYSEEYPLLFTQYVFWAFFTVILLFYGFVYKRPFARIAYLLSFSLFFYYKQSGYYFSLLIFSTIVDYYIGNFIYHSKKDWLRKVLIILSIAVNLFVLGFFKYSYFFADSLNALAGTELTPYNFFAGLANSIAGSRIDVTSIILPVGISFYTFQTISYSVDIYRRKIEPVRNIIDFAFFVSYFPQLVAGPIVRAAEFIPQLYKPYSLTNFEFGRACFLIINGLIKKILISDFISSNFVDRVFESPLRYTGVENLLAVYGYTLQIYCDFSGYTDIAIGVSALLGFALPINFNSPYKAHNITDFWRRWHISFSTWLRDYLYIPLGGNRKGRVRMYVNLFITMLLGGLWHGAHLRFIIWGGLHGLALAFHKGWTVVFPQKIKTPLLGRLVGVFITFHFVSFCWIFFRAKDMLTVEQVLSSIRYNFKMELLPEILTSYKYIFDLSAFGLGHLGLNVFGLMVAGFIIHWLPVRFKDSFRAMFIQWPILIKAVVASAVAIVLYQITSAGSQPFIYFQF
ncbi:MAG: MBOAT family protein [Bacteroidota bacterium]|nr:MBOAT family protein [Bacteroidota bacterium]